MAVKQDSEHELVQKAMQLMCKRAGFADCANMVQRDLEYLCGQLESKTGVLISLSTMRRLLKGEFARMPQVATLDAIAQFIGYTNWQQFKRENEGVTPATSVAEPVITKSVSRPGRWFWIAAILVIIFSTGMIVLLKPSKSALANIDKASFSMTRTTATDIPNSVVFHYDVEAVKADSFFIQQSWDSNRRKRIDQHQHTLTDIYYEPGYHIAKLVANDSIIRTIDVSIPTDRWFFYAKENLSADPVYIHASKPLQNGVLALDASDITGSKINTNKSQIYTYCYFPSSIKGSADNYVLRCAVKMKPIRNDYCPYLVCEVFCQRNFMYFMSNLPGCTSETMAQFGEHKLDGKTQDLSALATDVMQWQQVELRVEDKQVSIQLNGKKVLTTNYNDSGGKITGIGFLSNGLPEVKHITLQTLDGEILFQQ